MATAAEILAEILVGMGIFGVFLVMGWIIFGYLNTIHEWLHRRDLNKNLRKDTHILYANTIDKIFEDINTNDRITDKETLNTLIALINSATGRIRAKRFKESLFDKHIIIKQLKNAIRDGISPEFRINRNISVDKLLKNAKLLKEVKSINEKDASKLIILIATAAFTEQSEVISYDSKYDDVVRQINHIHEFSKKDMMSLFRLGR